MIRTQRRTRAAVAGIVFCLLLSATLAPVSEAARPPDSKLGGPERGAPTATAAGLATTNNTTAPDNETTGSGVLSGAAAYQLSHAAADELVPVILVFDDHSRGSNNATNESDAGTRARRRAATNRTQSDVRDFLDARRANGTAADVKPFWTRNALAVEATPAVVRTLGGMPNVSAIHYDRPIYATGSVSPSVAAYLDALSAYGDTVRADRVKRATSGTSGTESWNLESIGADDVQDRGITGAGVNVSVIDSGIDDSHPALRGQVVRWKDFVGNSSQPFDPWGHGTHVAGTVAGRADANKSVGVAPETRLFGARALDEDGQGSMSDVMAAMEWSAENRADVVSASLGASPFPLEYRGERAVRPNGTGASDIELYANGSGVYQASARYDGFKPAYVYVLVEPTQVGGEQIQSDERRAEVMRNLSVTLRDPAGDTPLRGVDAGWWFEDGRVPDAIAYQRFSPRNETAIETPGNWSLAVESDHPESVSYRYRATAYYPSNGSDQFSRYVDSLVTTTDTVAVISAGNAGLLGNRSVASPGASAGAITVGAARQTASGVTSFSSRGPVGFGDDRRPGIALIAPGENVTSAYSTSQRDEAEPYVTLDGTSMAAPHVSGTVALLLDANPNATRADVTRVLRSTARPLPQTEPAVGAGMLDTWSAVNETAALPRAVTNETAPPTDPDGDGRYEDINGDGNVTLADVQALFAHRDAEAVESTPEAFDFSGNGRVNVVDVQALFAEIRTS
ncbi:S8 family serine peptidase [Haloferax prahovense]|uniref:S8 family serine peptidase n=1 Tax=Haloferax prahovense TaxID=381852 RepID=UPI003C718EBC